MCEFVCLRVKESVCEYVHVCVFDSESTREWVVCACACACERERDRERERVSAS